MRGFVGGTVDPDTGLTRLGARDPITGRFISVDPLVGYGRTSTMNPYSCSNNAPATFSDPDGLSYSKGKGGGYGPRGHDRGEGANALGSWLQQWLMQQWRELSGNSSRALQKLAAERAGLATITPATSGPCRPGRTA